MIISASRRTDIPAFYAEWFMNRVREGFFYRVNPFNANQVSGFSLKPEDVDAICFWTKNPEPLLQHLDELDQRGLNYYFQVTLNPYSKVFEPGVPSLEQRIATFQELAERIGKRRVIWRYDPVILTSHNPVSWHLEQAEWIASQLQESTERLVFSFYDFYGKGRGRLHAALEHTGIVLEDITWHGHRPELDSVVEGFKAIADRHKFDIFSCSEDVDLLAKGIAHGACIDGKLIKQLFGGAPAEKKDKNQRQACGCVESVDMGIYNTCKFRCAYCYANFNEGIIDKNIGKHNVNAPAMLGEHEKTLEIKRALTSPKKKPVQQELF
jgi:DNA repair photolyase